MLTLLTPTGDRHAAFALCERWMRQQTLWGRREIQWIVVDDGDVPVTPTLGQEYLRRERGTDAPVESFCHNLLEGLARVRGSRLLLIEDDDYYAPDHLEKMTELLRHPGVLLVGDPHLRYYHLGHRHWRAMDNTGSALCQTGMKAELVEFLVEIVRTRLVLRLFDVDVTLWRYTPKPYVARLPLNTVVGIKGLPGRHGLGIGHRDDLLQTWTADPDLVALQTWIGGDVEAYRGFGAALDGGRV